MKLRAIGITCGIGSLLIGARQAGFDVTGNVEWRKYYHARDPDGRNSFCAYFHDVVFKEKITDFTPQEIERLMMAEIALGHPECGKYSQLNSMNKDQSDDPGDIPLFVDLVAQLRPRYFVMDDLPKSFIAFPMSEYHDRLPDYDLFPEWVSNYHYGNVQKNRRRMFMIGALKMNRFVFRPGEREHSIRLRDVIGDLPEPRVGGNFPNQDLHTLDGECGKAKHIVTLGRDRRATYLDLKNYFDSVPNGTTLHYVGDDGREKSRPGNAAAYWDRHAHVLDGGSVQVHPIRHTPYTIRERARIQGFPDDFVFYGTRYRADGTYDHEDNTALVKQTGKAMPVQFARYVSEQIMAYIQGKPFACSNQRLIEPNPYIDEAKSWYCSNVGYADQKSACGACWLYARCKIRTTKYNIEAVVVDARPLGKRVWQPVLGASLDSRSITRQGRVEQKADRAGVPVRSRPAPRISKSRFVDRAVDEEDIEL